MTEQEKIDKILELMRDLTDAESLREIQGEAEILIESIEFFQQESEE